MFFILSAMQPNANSLHRIYRDRLARAFLFLSTKGPDVKPLTELKLSELDTSKTPYHIINTAMNVQSSAEANRRGRNADFFMFTRDYVGSDLTMFAKSKGSSQSPGMEEVDPHLDLATAMAISLRKYGFANDTINVANACTFQYQTWLLATQSAIPLACTDPRSRFKGYFPMGVGELLSAVGNA
jgi:hypothetical protein